LKLEALNEAMKQHKISVPKPSSTSKGHALSAQALYASSNSWILDSGASHHMTHSHDLLASTSECSISQIAVGDSTQLDVLGSGTVQLDKGCINDVLLVPHISANLLSIYQICHSGNGKTVEFSPNDVIIRELQNPDIVVASGKVDHSSRMYKFASFESSLGSSFIAHADALSKLWHERFGHLNYRYLQQLSTQKLVLGLPKVSCTDGVCPGCVLGKQHQDPFPKGKAWRATTPLELVHSDLMSFPTRSFSGAKYALTFIDDFSRRSWVYFLKYKSEVLATFKNFKAFVEKQSSFSIKKLRTDNGGEYVNQGFTDFCREHGIQHQLTVPYNPQQNGVAERKNRTLKEMANCMIQSKNMAPSFWAEAVNCANYIQNRMPHRAVLHKTPEEAWSHVKPDVSAFRVFGSPAWALIPVEKRKAMEKKSQPLIFVGYCEDIKAYRLFEPITKEVFFRRAVRFDEGFNTTSNPSPSSDCHVDNCVEFALENDDEPFEVQHQPEENLPPAAMEHEHHEQIDLEHEQIDQEHEQLDQELHLRRSLREKKRPDRYGYEPTDFSYSASASSPIQSQTIGVSFLSHTISNDPQQFSDAVGIPEWDAAMTEEYSSLIKNHTWDLVSLPKGRKLVRCKWIYKTKYAADGSVDKHKAHLVAKGFSQVEGIDYSETFAPVAKMNSIRLVLSLAASQGWSVYQMDVKSAFLHGDLDEEIYMEQPPGFVQDSSLVCRLRRSLYGLKQAPRAWYEKMDSFLISSGFDRCHSDPTVYTQKHGTDLLILVLYVDDLILTGSSSSMIQSIQQALMGQFEMTDLGLLHYFLGLQVLQSSEGISIFQQKYALDLLQRFGMVDCKPAPTPFQSGVTLSASCSSPRINPSLYRQLIGSLLYLTHTRPDISFAVGLVSRFSQDPHESHWKAAKRILRYIQGTTNFGIQYSSGASQLVGFTDSDWAGSVDDRKSTSGFVYCLGSAPVTWSCKKQSAIALSSAEAEYRAAVLASQEVLWLRQLLTEFGIQQDHPTTLWCDNQSAIHISRNPVEHQRTKHIEIHMHFIRQLIQDGVLNLEYLPTEAQVADIFTKPLASPRFLQLRLMLGVKAVVSGGLP
jgi:hypothetical protein